MEHNLTQPGDAGGGGETNALNKPYSNSERRKKLIFCKGIKTG